MELRMNVVEKEFTFLLTYPDGSQQTVNIMAESYDAAKLKLPRKRNNPYRYRRVNKEKTKGGQPL